jgi:hypothetical protein
MYLVEVENPVKFTSFTHDLYKGRFMPVRLRRTDSFTVGFIKQGANGSSAMLDTTKHNERMLVLERQSPFYRSETGGLAANHTALFATQKSGAIIPIKLPELTQPEKSQKLGEEKKDYNALCTKLINFWDKFVAENNLKNTNDRLNSDEIIQKLKRYHHSAQNLRSKMLNPYRAKDLKRLLSELKTVNSKFKLQINFDSDS